MRLHGLTELLEELRSNGTESVRWDINELILLLTHLMKERGWISLPSSKYLN